MATLVPPPTKKQKTAQAAKAREQAEIDTIPDGLGSIRVQFHDAATGQPTGASVAVPVADASVRNLEGVVNVLLGNAVCMSRLFFYSRLEAICWTPGGAFQSLIPL
jgi:ribosome assembly protein 4